MIWKTIRETGNEKRYGTGKQNDTERVCGTGKRYGTGRRYSIGRAVRFAAMLAAAVMLSAVPAAPAEAAQTSGSWGQEEDGRWFYTDGSGERLCAAVTPDGYLTDVLGYWDETPYDTLVGSYTVESDTLDGNAVEEDIAGVIHTAKISLTAEKHLLMTEIWGYANGGVLRKASTEYYPNTNGTFQVYWYPERKGNDLRWRDIAYYSNASGFTDNGDGSVTVTSASDSGTRVTVFRKN